MRGGRSLPPTVALALAVALMHGCAAVRMPAVDEAVRGAAMVCALPIEQVEHGRQLMVTNCVACHQPVHPGSLSMEEWDELLPRMLRKAELTPAHGRDIRAYLVAVQQAKATSTPRS